MATITNGIYASELAPLIPIADGFAIKEDITLETSISALKKLDTRDKATKIMQYGARFLYWWFGETDPVLSRKAYKLYRTTSLSRKSFRMFKLVDEALKLRTILRNARGRRLQYNEALLAARCLAMGCFWTFDNLSYLSTTETVSFGVARATRLFARAWSVGSVLLALLGLEALRKSGNKRKELASAYAALLRGDALASTSCRGTTGGSGGSGGGGDAGEQEKGRLREALEKANAEHFKSWLMLVKGVLDLTCAINIAGVDLPRRLTGKKLNDGVIGAAGVGSALTVIYNAWPARVSKS